MGAAKEMFGVFKRLAKTAGILPLVVPPFKNGGGRQIIVATISDQNIPGDTVDSNAQRLPGNISNNLLSPLVLLSQICMVSGD